MMRLPNGGFSLIELLAASAIIGIMAAVAVPVIKTTALRQKEHDLRVALRDIRRGIDAYKEAAISGHITLQSGDSGYPHKLVDLTNGVVDAGNQAGPKMYFLRRIPRDPFAIDPTLTAADTWGLRSFDSPADKPSSGNDVFDVYSNATGTAMNGVPYREW